MVRNKELEAGLKAIAEDSQFPGGGRMALSKLVADHLGWFEAAERRGMGWRDMIRALTAAGVTGRTGEQLSVGTLSSTVWREREKMKQGDARDHRQMRHAPPPARPQARQIQPPIKRTGGNAPSPAAKAVQPAPDSLRPPKSGARSNANKDVLAFMDRARAVRRRPE